MAVKIRLTRLGKKKQPTYRVVVIDSRKQRDGKYIEQLGFYDPRQDPSIVEINNERALYWLRTGAQPTERAQKLLEISGAWTQFRVAKGDIHTIGADESQDAPEPDADVVDESAEVEVPEGSAEAEVIADTAEDVAQAATEEAVDAAAVEAAAETIEETEAIESSEEA